MNALFIFFQRVNNVLCWIRLLSPMINERAQTSNFPTSSFLLSSLIMIRSNFSNETKLCTAWNLFLVALYFCILNIYKSMEKARNLALKYRNFPTFFLEFKHNLTSNFWSIFDVFWYRNTWLIFQCAMINRGSHQFLINYAQQRHTSCYEPLLLSCLREDLTIFQ